MVPDQTSIVFGPAAPVSELQAAGCFVGMGTDNMADVLITLLEGQVESIVMPGFEVAEFLNEKDNEHEIEIQGKTDISETEKERTCLLLIALGCLGLVRPRVGASC